MTPDVGPLRGVKVVELAGIGPGPHACTLLADLGADVIRIERPGGAATRIGPHRSDFLTRGRPSVALDLKNPRAVGTVLDLVERADVLVEGFRPGVTERLGLGPDACLARNPRLVYGRMTGWGQDGPWAQMAGHDLTYLAVTGSLHSSGQDPDRPQFAQNLVGDFGGGSMFLVVGVLAALVEARVSGHGQVVDAAIVDGVSHLNLMWAGMLDAGAAREERGVNAIDGGVARYRVYETADGRHVALAAMEPAFQKVFAEKSGLGADASAVEIAAYFVTRTRDEWAAEFEGTDGCVSPVLTYTEATTHPHLVARGVFAELDGTFQPAPAPRFSRTSTRLTTGPEAPGASTRVALEAWGISGVDDLIASGAAVQV